MRERASGVMKTKIGSKIGKGLKLDIYLRQCDLWVVDEIQKKVDATEMAGYSTSFNFELVKILRLSLRRSSATATAAWLISPRRERSWSFKTERNSYGDP